MTLGSDGPNDDLISNPLEIGGLLRNLANQRDGLIIDYAQWHIVTRILDVDITARTFIFYGDTNQSKNESALKADRCVFHATPRGVRIEFVIGRVQDVVFEEKPTFKARFPSVLLCLQRRAYFRVRTPALNPYLCSGSFPNGECFRAEIVDLSLGGVALRVMDDHLGNLEAGGIVRDAELRFTSQSSITVELQFVSYRLPTCSFRSSCCCRRNATVLPAL